MTLSIMKKMEQIAAKMVGEVCIAKDCETCNEHQVWLREAFELGIQVGYAYYPAMEKELCSAQDSKFEQAAHSIAEKVLGDTK